jgi:uncharacterized protein
MAWLNTPCTAFEGSQRIASGPLKDVAPIAKIAVDKAATSSAAQPVLIFDDATGEVIELDWRGSPGEFAARLAVRALGHEAGQTQSLGQSQTHSPHAASVAVAEPTTSANANVTAPRGPGRPRLGVVAREVTLLPRHWDWLGQQTGGASVALRKLVEAASRASAVQDRVRQSSAVGYKFMATIAGHEPGFEEASRALFAADQAAFEAQIAHWPTDVQTHLKKILADAFFWA